MSPKIWKAQQGITVCTLKDDPDHQHTGTPHFFLVSPEHHICTQNFNTLNIWITCLMHSIFRTFLVQCSHLNPTLFLSRVSHIIYLHASLLHLTYHASGLHYTSRNTFD